MNSVSGSPLPNEISEILIKNYQTLLQNPKPEDEERIHTEMIEIFKKLVINSQPDTEFQHKCEIIQELIEAWEPLDYWFVELPELPIILRDFLIDFANFKPFSEKKALLPREGAKILSKNLVKDGDLNISLEDDEEEKSITPEESNRINKRIEQLQERMKHLKQKFTPKDTNRSLNIPSIPKSGGIQKNVKKNLTPPKIIIPQEDLNHSFAPSIELSDNILSIEKKPTSSEIENTAEIPDKKPNEKSTVKLTEKSANNPIKFHTREEIDEILDLEQIHSDGSKLLTQIFVKNAANPQNPDIILKDVFDQSNFEQLEKKTEEQIDPELLYQELLRFRGKLTHLQLKYQQLKETYKKGELPEERFKVYLEQNKSQIEEIKTKISHIERNLF
ncbi:MAG: hypothetical protein ACTSWC_08555 [Promethearchaeota archaeon]